MMPMTPEIAQLHVQDMLREAKADRLYSEAQRGEGHSAGHLLAPVRAAISAIARVGQHRLHRVGTRVRRRSGQQPVQPVQPARSVSSDSVLPTQTLQRLLMLSCLVFEFAPVPPQLLDVPLDNIPQLF
jgi:hypothetical protein